MSDVLVEAVKWLLQHHIKQADANSGAAAKHLEALERSPLEQASATLLEEQLNPLKPAEEQKPAEPPKPSIVQDIVAGIGGKTVK